MAKTPEKKGASAADGIALTPAQIKKAKSCLEKSGKVRIAFKEISVTKLPARISPIRVFID